jgi:hypothetical protein
MRNTETDTRNGHGGELKERAMSSENESQAVAVDATHESDGANHITKSEQSESKGTSGEIQFRPSGELANRPIGPSDIEVENALSMSGYRPIAASKLKIAGYLLGNRPISASNLRVVDIDSIPGHRPVFATDIEVLDVDTLPGHRPIVASSPDLMRGSHLPGNRPIASNDIDDPDTTMGFLD